MKKVIFLITLVIVVGSFYIFGGRSVEAPESIGEVVNSTVENEQKVFNVTGKDYEFSITEIRVKEGDTVVINFTSTNGFHDWVVNEFAVGTERVTKGNSSSTTFVADKKGEFEFYCSVGSHRAKGMIGTLIVE